MAEPSIAWRLDPCAACGRTLDSRLLLLVDMRRTAEDTIALVSPSLAKVCDEVCLARWLRERGA